MPAPAPPRWSRPPLLRSPPKDSVLASYAINESSDESDNDVVAPLVRPAEHTAARRRLRTRARAQAQARLRPTQELQRR